MYIFWTYMLSEQKHLQSSLDDIDLALEAGYPKDISYKLLERRAKCLVHLERYGEARGSLDHAIGMLMNLNVDRRYLSIKIY